MLFPLISKFSMIYGAFKVPEPLHQSCTSAQVQLCAARPVAVPLIKIGFSTIEPEVCTFDFSEYG